MTCDRVIVINEGRIIAQDNVSNLEKTFSKVQDYTLSERPRRNSSGVRSFEGVSSAEEK